MARTINTVIPNPDDVVNGVIVGVTVSFYRNGAGVAFARVSYPLDPDGDFDVPLTQLAAADRTKVKDVALAVLALYKTARSFV